MRLLRRKGVSLRPEAGGPFDALAPGSSLAKPANAFPAPPSGTQAMPAPNVLTRIFPRLPQTENGSAISPTSTPPKAGCIWRRSWICFRVESWAGPWTITWKLPWCKRLGRWLCCAAPPIGGLAASLGSGQPVHQPGLSTSLGCLPLPGQYEPCRQLLRQCSHGKLFQHTQN